MNTPIPGRKSAIASVVLGILSLCFGGLFLGIIGIVLAIRGSRKLSEHGYSTSLATAGLILSILGAIFGSKVFFTFWLPIILIGGFGLLGAMASL